VIPPFQGKKLPLLPVRRRDALLCACHPRPVNEYCSAPLMLGGAYVRFECSGCGGTCHRVALQVFEMLWHLAPNSVEMSCNRSSTQVIRRPAGIICPSGREISCPTGHIINGSACGALNCRRRGAIRCWNTNGRRSSRSRNCVPAIVTPST